ncbi:hypothetical protein DM860_000675 [Cuscuta australis]|uniref:DUF1230 family protein n=1 Tax=Cuscuta australis TaxID=267555 RepID=A0A328D0C7_9ASTE|nr:hypothetical protein DM860_000675 [Cuscuta australis]
MAISQFLSSTPLAPSLQLSSTKPHRHFRINRRYFTVTPSAASSSSSNGNHSPPQSATACPVPPSQQPVNEFKALSESFPFYWASGDLNEYISRLFLTGSSFALLVGLPVLWFGSVRPESDPLKPVLGAAFSGLFVVTLAVVRMYLGWDYISNRLLSATVEYEESGWYDGQTWVKTPETLARDRLLGSFSVKPVLGRLKNTLGVLATSLLLCAALLLLISAEPGSAQQVAVPGVYTDESVRLFEADPFHGEPDLS